MGVEAYPPSLANADLQPSAKEGKTKESLLTGYLTDRLTLGDKVSFCFCVIQNAHIEVTESGRHMPQANMFMNLKGIREEILDLVTWIFFFFM